VPKKTKKGGGGNSRQRTIAKMVVAKESPRAASMTVLPLTSSPTHESFVGRLLGLDGLSFAFLASTALVMVSINEFYAAGWFFILAAMALAFKLTNLIDAKSRYQKLLVAGMFSAACGVAVSRVNDWAMSRLSAANDGQAIRSIVYVREVHDPPRKRGPNSTEPNDRQSSRRQRSHKGICAR
jgi:hypothetical protein